MNYLLDTCVISDFFKKIPSVINHFKAVSPQQIHIAALTVMEIEYGLRLNAEREKSLRLGWEDFLKYIQVIPYSSSCAIASASIRAILKRKGLLVGPYDILIAGTSLAHSMIMVTSNTAEFSRIPEVVLEDWRN